MSEKALSFRINNFSAREIYNAGLRATADGGASNGKVRVVAAFAIATTAADAASRRSHRASEVIAGGEADAIHATGTDL